MISQKYFVSGNNQIYSLSEDTTGRKSDILKRKILIENRIYSSFIDKKELMIDRKATTEEIKLFIKLDQTPRSKKNRSD